MVNRYVLLALACVPLACRSSAPQVAPLVALRDAFRPAYDHALADVQTDLSPLVVVRFSDMYLVRDDYVIATYKGIPRKYHLLHRVAHVPLVVYLTLRPYIDHPLTDEVAQGLYGYRRRVDAALTDLENYGFSSDEIATQRAVLQMSSQLLGAATAGSIIPAAVLDDYLERVRPPMMSLADIAGVAQVDALHNGMAAWRAQLSPDEWAALRVIIIGFRQPRHDYAATQYFAALFPSESNSIFPGENDRVFYVESLDIDRDDRVFRLEKRSAAALILDQMASQAIFHDADRMSMDVMADGAKRRVSELFDRNKR